MQIAMIIGYVALAVLVFIAYRQGLKDGRQIERNEPVKPMFSVGRDVKAEQTEDEKLLEWAEGYNG